MLAELSFWLGVLLFGLAPGLLLLRITRTGWTWPETLAAAPGISLSTVAAGAYLSNSLGLPVSPLGILPTLVGVAALLFVLRLLQAKVPDPRAKPDGLVTARKRHPPPRHPLLGRPELRMPDAYSRYIRE